MAEPIHGCGMCDGPLEPQGRLGRHDTYHCRNCGWWHISKDCCDGGVFHIEDDDGIDNPREA